MIYLFLFIFNSSVYGAQVNCEYSYTVWNTILKKSEGPFRVNKPYSQLSKLEKSPEGCTPCEIDQQLMRLNNGLSFTACKSFAQKFKKTLDKILESGRKIETVLGYRPSISKGQMDALGRRTVFSHHAFGTAIDINENFNGLYTNCINWNAGCQLIKGGAYSPQHPLAIRDNDEFVTNFKGLGLRWGGQIQGIQKDFMHFSFDGY
jgi:hypothetical protein